MFNQQQQLQQHLRQLQHLLQQQQPLPPPPAPTPPHHHQAGRIAPPPQAPPPRMVNLCSAPQATIIAANPMLQGALLMQHMQGNLRGFAVGGQQFPQFFPAGSRASLLGPAPMGVAIKTPHMGFPPRHFHPHPRYVNKDFTARPPERKRESDVRAVGDSDGQSGAKSTEGESSDRAVSTEGTVVLDEHTPPLAELQEEPALKKQRTEGSEGVLQEPPEADGALSSDYKCSAEEKEPGDGEALEERGSVAGPETMEFMEESRAAEVLGIGASLKVTIQQSSESRAFSTGGVTGSQGEAREPGGDAASRFFCYICSITCQNQQSFQSHMNGVVHQQRMMEIQRRSNACLGTLLPRVRESLQSQRDGERRPSLQRWCSTCQTHFSGDLIQHRRTKEHKLSKHSARPFCTVCKRHFRTPRKFVEHMKSPEHKQRVEELREEGGPEVLEELITVDAVGCFEGEEDYEEEPNEEEEGEERGRAHSQVGLPAHKEVSLEDMGDDEEYDSDTQYGSSFVVPVAGFLCRLCHKFFHFESTARLSHCKSLTHFQNLQKYRALRNQPDMEEPDTCSSVEDTERGGTTRQEEEERERPAKSSPGSQDRAVQSHDPSTGHAPHCHPLNSSSAAAPSPRPCPSLPPPGSGEGKSRGDPPAPTPTSPQQRDLPESLRQGEGREEEGEEEGQDADVEEKPAIGSKRTASRRRVTRMTRRR
ncbi:cdkn1a interacting zinc finger protein 1b [Megalops cyprinoides]|uniref:cdkn1a interacting zinc finger protein 1b n=1 Tax=Megalops cyprinoides TaxID=118141 RepID=UPI001863E49E|nr:cdkn1a interacting zinc finger protein 1b [Megalops cyprinoides]